MKALKHFLRFFAFAAASLAGASGQAAELTLVSPSSGQPYIRIRGEINLEDDVAFRRLLLSGKPGGVILESDGGRLRPAIEIGKMIRVQGIETIVPPNRTCASSCALIWLAGTPRKMASTSRVGFHASYLESDGRVIETGLGNALVGHYLSSLNLPERAVLFATSASPIEISWLDGSNSASAGIDFILDPPIAFQDRKSSDSTTAKPTPFEWSGPPNWKVFELSKGCALTLTFDSERGVRNRSMLVVTYDPADQLSVMFIVNEKFRSLVPRRKYKMHPVFLRNGIADEGWGEKEALGFEGESLGKGFTMSLEAGALLADVASSEVLSIYANSRLVDTFSLEGSKKGVEKLRECAD